MLSLLSAWIALIIVVGCAPVKYDRFAIYLAKEKASYEVTDAQTAALTLEDTPFITTDDIIAYDRNTHKVELTPAAAEKLRKLEVPLMGRLFVACVGEKRIYAGAFMTPISSMMFRGVSIYKWLDSEQNTMLIGWVYSDGSPNPAQDPRNNSEIFDALARAGKLK